MTGLKKTRFLAKFTLAALLCCVSVALCYWLAVMVPPGRTLGFIQTVRAYGVWLTVGRFVVLAVLYGIVLHKINSFLKKGDLNPAQRKFLLGLRWQALMAFLLLEFLIGKHGLSRLGG